MNCQILYQLIKLILRGRKFAVIIILQNGKEEYKVYSNIMYSRYIGISNTADVHGKDLQIKEMLSMLSLLQEDNSSPYYTNEMFDEAKKALQRAENEAREKAEAERLVNEYELREKLEAEKKHEIELLNSELEENVNKMKVLEEERQREEEKHRRELEKAKEKKLKEEMARFRKQQEDERRKEEERQVMMIQAELEWARWQAEKKLKEMARKQEQQRNALHSQVEERQNAHHQRMMRLYQQQRDMEKSSSSWCTIS